MFMLAIAVAQLSAAEPINPVRWFYDADWEKLVVKTGGRALVVIRVTVTPEGQPQDCIIESSSGIPKLNDLTCKLVMEKARFRPAKWGDKTSGYAVYRRSVLWADRTSFEYQSPVDVELKLSKMPPGVRRPTSLTLDFAVAPDGARSSCQARERNANPALVSIGCQQVLASYPAIAARDKSGAPVPSIQNVSVSFVTK